MTLQHGMVKSFKVRTDLNNVYYFTHHSFHHVVRQAEWDDLRVVKRLSLHKQKGYS